MSMDNNEFMNRLTAEMDAMMGDIPADLNSASVEEMVRTTLRILIGNGKPIHSLIAKTASINLRVDDIRSDMNAASSKLDIQTKKCNDIQLLKERELAVQEAVSHAQHGMTPVQQQHTELGHGSVPYMLGQFVITNWKPLAIFVVAGMIYLSNIMLIKGSNPTAQQHQQHSIEALEKAVDLLTKAAHNGDDQHAHNSGSITGE
jgi:hypothetical protein